MSNGNTLLRERIPGANGTRPRRKSMIRSLIDSNLNALTRDEEVILLDAINNENDVAGKEALISTNQRALLYFAKRYEKLCPPSIDMEDLISEGIVGILNAIRDYEIDGPAKFSTFASYYIRSYMLQAIRRAGRFSKSCKGEVSINAPLSGKYEDMTIAGILKDSSDTSGAYEEKEKSLFIHDCLDLLDLEEKMVLSLLYGLSGDDSLTCQDVARETGLPALEVKRLEIQGLTKIRTMLNES